MSIEEIMYHSGMKDQDIPGHLKTISNPDTWLDIFFKSRLSSDHKLVGVVIARSCVYNRQKTLQESLISSYSISRVLGKSQPEVNALVEDLERLGWLYNAGRARGAKKVHYLTFSKIPLGEDRE
jgi:hypothetical protein